MLWGSLGPRAPRHELGNTRPRYLSPHTLWANARLVPLDLPNHLRDSIMHALQPLTKRLTLKLAKEITGHITGLGKPSKMPGFSTATSADACITGAKLAKVPGTPCFHCYAKNGNYQYPDVRKGHARRLAALANPLWVEGMARLIGHYTHKTPTSASTTRETSSQWSMSLCGLT